MLLDEWYWTAPVPVQFMWIQWRDMDIVCQFFAAISSFIQVKRFKFFGDILSGIVCLIGIQWLEILIKMHGYHLYRPQTGWRCESPSSLQAANPFLFGFFFQTQVDCRLFRNTQPVECLDRLMVFHYLYTSHIIIGNIIGGDSIFPSPTSPFLLYRICW